MCYQRSLQVCAVPLWSTNLSYFYTPVPINLPVFFTEFEWSLSVKCHTSSSLFKLRRWRETGTWKVQQWWEWTCWQHFVFRTVVDLITEKFHLSLCNWVNFRKRHDFSKIVFFLLIDTLARKRCDSQKVRMFVLPRPIKIETAENHDVDRTLFDRVMPCSITNDQRQRHSHWTRIFFCPALVLDLWARQTGSVLSTSWFSAVSIFFFFGQGSSFHSLRVRLHDFVQICKKTALSMCEYRKVPCHSVTKFRRRTSKPRLW